MKATYQQPALELYGGVADLTRFSQTPTREDSVFLNGNVVAGAPTGIGSVDQCIFGPGSQNPDTEAVCI